MTANSSAQHAHPAAELQLLLQRNRCGAARGIYAICSANQYVLEAGMRQAARKGEEPCRVLRDVRGTAGLGISKPLAGNWLPAGTVAAYVL